MKVLITGSNGFVGKYLCRVLDFCELVGLDRSNGDKVDYVVDLLDKEKLRIIVEKEKPDFIFHLAAQSSVQKAINNGEETIDNNLISTKNIIDIIEEIDGDIKLVFISSSNVYGVPKYLPVDEAHELAPVESYGLSKLKCEKAIIASKISYMILRPFTHIGPGQGEMFVTGAFAKQIVEVEMGKIDYISTGRLDVKRDFTDVRDIVNAYSLVLRNFKNKGVYNLCSGSSYSIKSILELLSKGSSVKCNYKEDESKFRKNEIFEFKGNCDKFKKDYQWVLKYTIEETLADIMDFWRRKIEQ